MADIIATIRSIEASNYVKPYQPSRVLDNSVSPVSRWLCNSPSGWLCADLGVPTPVKGYSVALMGAAGWNAAFNNCNIALAGSNDKVNWTNLDSFTNANVNTVTRTFNPVVFRYIRLSISNSLTLNNKVASVVSFSITQAPVSADLTALAISSGALDPAFASAGTSYTVSVPNSVSSITLTPTAQDPSATIMVGSNRVTSGQASQPVSLNVGANAITVQVTGIDGVTKKTYTVNVTRASSVDLSSINCQTGTLEPVFSSGELSYTLYVSSGTESVWLQPVPQDAQAKVTVNGTDVSGGGQYTLSGLIVGDNGPATIVVTAAVGKDSKTYSVKVVRASSAYLRALAIYGRVLSPSPFNKQVYSYTAGVDNTTTSVKVMAFAEDQVNVPVITVNGTVVSSGAQMPVDLNVGNNTITVQVNPKIGKDTKTYIITVTRANA